MTAKPEDTHLTTSKLLALALLVGMVNVGPLAAQGPPEIFPNGAVNAASFRPPDFPGGTAAPGAMITLFGHNLGPAEGVMATSLPWPSDLGPLNTRVMVNDTQECRLYYVSEGQINCQLPDEPIRDQEEIRLRVVTTQGQSDEITVPLGPAGFGLFTMNANGRGPLVAQNFMQDPDRQRRFQLNTPETPGQQGQIMVLWGTGLGPTNPPVGPGEAAPAEAPAVNQPRVFVGDVEAQVRYAGRAPDFAGLDQIQFDIPEDAPSGCAVPIRLQLQDQDQLYISNIGTVAINRQQERCLDPVEDVISGLSHGSIVLGSGLGVLGPGQLGPQRGPAGPFATGMGPGGMGPGDGMGFGGGVQSGPGGVGPDGIGPFGLHPGIPPHSGGLGTGVAASLGTNVATARFVRLGQTARTDIGIPPAATNSCTSYFQGPQEQAGLLLGPVEFLDAGALMLAGPEVALTLTAEAVSAGVLYAADLPGPLQSGMYSVSGSGGSDVGAFGPVELTVPPLLDVTTDLAPGTTVSRAEGLTLAWANGAVMGRNPEEIVLIHGRSFHIPAQTGTPVADPMQFRSQSFLCSTTVGQGQFAIPDHVLETLPDGLLVINVTHFPPADDIARFEAEGLDLGGVFRWIDSTTYLDLVLGP